jgi:hypothetical protein
MGTKQLKVCSYEDCDNTGKIVRGLCDKHYKRLYRHGDPSKTLRVANGTYKDATCEADGCEEKPWALGLCNTHYARLFYGRDMDHKRNQAGENNNNWKGDDVGYHGRHSRVDAARGKASEYTCVCGSPAYDWAHTHGTDPLDVYNYEPRCREHHSRYDKGGEKCYKAKFTPDEVREIRATDTSQRGQKTELARHYDVARSTIYGVVTERTYKDVAP